MPQKSENLQISIHNINFLNNDLTQQHTAEEVNTNKKPAK
jgi:hypothetical protein